MKCSRITTKGKQSMIKLMKYLKKSAGYIVLIIGLLFLQAYCDLSLPDYTSKIINVGIQQGGIPDGVPEILLLRFSAVFRLRERLPERRQISKTADARRLRVWCIPLRSSSFLLC